MNVLLIIPKKFSVKYILFFALLLIFATGCKMDPPILPNSSDTTKGGQVVTPPAGDGTYQPVTSGSYWVYKNILSGVTDTDKATLDGTTATFDGRKFFEGVTAYQSQNTTSVAYLSNEDHIYIDYTNAGGLIISMYYLNDTTAVGHGWTSPINDSGQLNGIPGQFMGSIIEKGISKTVEDKTYTNVIHSRVMLQYDYGSGFETEITYDNYCAKNIGIIEIDTNGLGVTGVETLLSYSIK